MSENERIQNGDQTYFAIAIRKASINSLKGLDSLRPDHNFTACCVIDAWHLMRKG